MLVSRFKQRTLIVAGTLIFALSLFLFSWLLSPTVTVWTLLIPMLLLGAGFGISNIPRMNALLSSAPPALAGIASATNNAIVQLGNAMGIAVTVALVTTFGRSYYRGELTKAGLSEDLDEWLSEKVLSAIDFCSRKFFLHEFCTFFLYCLTTI